MGLTKKEQKIFEEIFNESLECRSNKAFLRKISKIIFEMTGSVNIRMRLDRIADRIR